jgi:hypothetical protein
MTKTQLNDLTIRTALIFAVAAFLVALAVALRGTTPCASADGTCPVGSTSTFSQDIGIQAGTVNTMRITGTPTADRVYTLPDATGQVAVSAAQNNFTVKQFIGDVFNTDMTLGLTINQGANDDAILSLKSSDVSHADGDFEADTYGQFQKKSATAGGLEIRGIAEGTPGLGFGGVTIGGSSEFASEIKSTGGGASVNIIGTLYGESDLVGDDNVLGVYKGTGGDAVAFVDAEGDIWLNGGIDLEGGSNAGYLQAEEISDPGVAAADHGRLYFRDSGAGKTQLVVVFSSGAVQVIAEEP